MSSYVGQFVRNTNITLLPETAAAGDHELLYVRPSFRSLINCIVKGSYNVDRWQAALYYPSLLVDETTMSESGPLRILWLLYSFVQSFHFSNIPIDNNYLYWFEFN